MRLRRISVWGSFTVSPPPLLGDIDIQSHLLCLKNPRGLGTESPDTFAFFRSRKFHFTLNQDRFSTSRDIILNDQISISKFRRSEILDLLNKGFKIGIEHFDLAHDITTHAVRMEYKVKKIVGDNNVDNSDVVAEYLPSGKIENDIVNLLNVFKFGEIQPLGTVTTIKSCLLPGYSYSYWEQPFYTFRKPFRLTKKEASDFVDFWKNANSPEIKKRRFLSVSISRFGQAKSRKNKEDSLIDYMISSEALFLSQIGEIPGELTYRLSHRAAFFLADKRDQREQIFRFFKSAYSLRSSIVHGSSKPIKLPQKEDGTKYNLNDFCEVLEDYLRRAIKKSITLANMSGSKEYLIDWDTIIFQ